MGDRSERTRKLIETGRQAASEELRKQEQDLTEQIFRLRFQLTTGQAESLKRLREARKDLARVKTLLREQQIAAGKQSAGKGKQA
jgi:large subunit ribosomal protein L29